MTRAWTHGFGSVDGLGPAKRGCANGNVVARAWCQHVLIWSFLGKKINSLFIATSSSELAAFGPVTVRSGAGPRGEDT